MCHNRCLTVIISTTIITKSKADSRQPCLFLVLHTRRDKGAILIEFKHCIHKIFVWFCVQMYMCFRDSIDSIFVEVLFIFSYQCYCSQSGCNRPLIVHRDFRPSAGHLGRSYAVYPYPWTKICWTKAVSLWFPRQGRTASPPLLTAWASTGVLYFFFVPPYCLKDTVINTGVKQLMKTPFP